jgi:hypothetical protein
MANNLGSLVVSLGLDAAEFTRGMSKGEYQAKQSADRIKSQFEDLTKYVAGLGIGAALVQSIRSTADYGDELGKLAQKAGTTTEEVSRLAYAARQADVDNEQLAKGLRALGEDAQTGGKKLAALGISVEDSNGKVKTSADLFREVAEAISRIDDPQRKAAAAAELLGDRLGPGLVPLLNQGKEGLKAMADEAERFGRVVTDDAAKAAEEFNDNITKLSEAGAGLAATIGNSVIPWVNKLVNEFNVGIKSAGGFWQAMSLGTINPFKDASTNIQTLRDDLKGLQGDRERYVRAGSDTRGIDDAIKTTETKLNYLAVLERQAQLSDNRRLGAEFGRDDPKLNSLRTRNSLYLPPVATPGKPPKAVSSRPAASSGRDEYQRMLDDYAKAEDDNRVGVITRRMKEEEDATRELLQFKRQFNIEELDSLEKRNTEYQKLVQTLIDDTPTQKLEQQRQTMQLLADEYERGRFGAAGSAEAIELYGETVGAYLGNLSGDVKKVSDAASQSGAIFGSWLNRAATDGVKLKDFLNGLARDYANLLLQKQLIEPAVKESSKWFDAAFGLASSYFSSYDGGGYTGMGARSGGVDGKGGFAAILHPNETVIDHTRGQGMGGVTVVQNVSIDARGADAGVEARIQSAMRQAKAEAVAEVQSRAGRGGSYARSLGRA